MDVTLDSSSDEDNDRGPEAKKARRRSASCPTTLTAPLTSFRGKSEPDQVLRELAAFQKLIKNPHRYWLVGKFAEGANMIVPPPYPDAIKPPTGKCLPDGSRYWEIMGLPDARRRPMNQGGTFWVEVDDVVYSEELSTVGCEWPMKCINQSRNPSFMFLFPDLLRIKRPHVNPFSARDKYGNPAIKGFADERGFKEILAVRGGRCALCRKPFGQYVLHQTNVAIQSSFSADKIVIDGLTDQHVRGNRTSHRSAWEMQENIAQPLCQNCNDDRTHVADGGFGTSNFSRRKA